MQPILERLAKGEVLIADGAMGTMLFRSGLRAGDCPESLNLKNPEILEEIARMYRDAGADIVQTNTFGASPMKLAEYGLDERTEEIIRRAVEAVRRGVGDRTYISGSCGPSGKILKPYGDADPEALFHGFERQAGALIGAGVDVICVETMTDLPEAILAIKAAKAVSPRIPVIATMTFDKTPKGYFTVMGVNVEAAVTGLQHAGADVVGSNCGNGIENMVEIAHEFKKATVRLCPGRASLPIIIQSNAGWPEIREGALVYPETPAFFADIARSLLDAGVSIIGGCCGTTPEHIRSIKRVIESKPEDADEVLRG